MVYSTSYQTYRKSQIMWFVDLSVAVKALAFEVKIVTVTTRFGVFHQYSSLKNVVAFFMLVGSEWFLVFGSMFLPDCDTCARTSARVNDGILDKSSDHPSVGYF